MAFTGHGTTITFSTLSVSYELISLGSWTRRVPSIDDSNIGTTGAAKKCFGEIYEHGAIEATVAFNPDVAAPLGTLTTITITDQPQSGQSTGAQLVGTGAIVADTTGTRQANERSIGTIEIEFDGQTGPTLTPGA